MDIALKEGNGEKASRSISDCICPDLQRRSEYVAGKKILSLILQRLHGQGNRYHRKLTGASCIATGLILRFNPPKADELATNTADKPTTNKADRGFMHINRIDLPPLGAIMDISVDTLLLCRAVVHCLSEDE